MRAARIATVTLAALLAFPLVALAATCQKMAIPSYFYPGPLWQKASAAGATATAGTTGTTGKVGAAGAVEIVVVNPDSGVGARINRDYVTAVRRAQAAGIAVIGYVYTSYGRRPAAKVLEEIAAYIQWYGVDGVFLDEVNSSAARVPYYQQFADIVHTAGLLVVLNPGTYPDEALMAAGDIVMVFEASFDEYRTLQVPAWVTNHDPGKFWHVIYGASTATRMRSALRWAQQRNAGYVYVTNDVLDNPYDSLPGYFAREIDELEKSCS